MKRIVALVDTLVAALNYIRAPDSIRNVVDEGSSLNKTVNGDVHANVSPYKQWEPIVRETDVIIELEFSGFLSRSLSISLSRYLSTRINSSYFSVTIN